MLREFAPLAGLHLAVFGLAFLWSSRSASGRGEVHPPDVVSFIATSAHIFWNNIQALAVLVITSAATAGAVGLVLLAANGYRFGAVVSLLSREAPNTVESLWIYAPLEVSAFALSGAVAVRIFSAGVRALRSDAGVGDELRRAAFALAIAVVALAVSAMLESHAITRGWRLN